MIVVETSYGLLTWGSITGWATDGSWEDGRCRTKEKTELQKPQQQRRGRRWMEYPRDPRNEIKDGCYDFFFAWVAAIMSRARYVVRDVRGGRVRRETPGVDRSKKESIYGDVWEALRDVRSRINGEYWDSSGSYSSRREVDI